MSSQNISMPSSNFSKDFGNIKYYVNLVEEKQSFIFDQFQSFFQVIKKVFNNISSNPIIFLEDYETNLKTNFEKLEFKDDNNNSYITIQKEIEEIKNILKELKIPKIETKNFQLKDIQQLENEVEHQNSSLQRIEKQNDQQLEESLSKQHSEYKDQSPTDKNKEQMEMQFKVDFQKITEFDDSQNQNSSFILGKITELLLKKNQPKQIGEGKDKKLFNFQIENEYLNKKFEEIKELIKSMNEIDPNLFRKKQLNQKEKNLQQNEIQNQLNNNKEINEKEIPLDFQNLQIKQQNEEEILTQIKDPNQNANNLLQDTSQFVDIEKIEQNQLMKIIFKIVQFTDEDQKQIQSLEKNKAKNPINQLIAKKIYQANQGTQYNSMQFSKKIFKQFYNSVSYYYRITLSYLEYVVILLKKYEFQEKLNIYKTKIQKFLDKQDQLFQEFKNFIQIESEEYFLDYDILFQKCEKFHEFLVKNYEEHNNLIAEFQTIIQIIIYHKKGFHPEQA